LRELKKLKELREVRELREVDSKTSLNFSKPPSTLLFYCFSKSL
jgi:hypothetical protein